MQITNSPLYEERLKFILSEMLKQLGYDMTKNFKLYLDTIILNIPTKIEKYKISPFFDDENIKEIDFQGFKIFFYHDAQADNFVILSIV